MRSPLFFLLTWCISLSLLAQENYDPAFGSDHHGYMHSIDVLPNGNLLLSTHFLDSIEIAGHWFYADSLDVPSTVFGEFTPNCIPIWTKVISLYANITHHAPTNHFYLSGRYSSDFTFQGTSFSYTGTYWSWGDNVLIMELDSIGIMTWHGIFDVSLGRFSFAFDQNDDLICMGTFEDDLTYNGTTLLSAPGISSLGFFMKLAGDGSGLVWVKETPFEDLVADFVLMEDGEIYAAVYSDGDTYDGVMVPTGYHVLKLDSLAGLLEYRYIGEHLQNRLFKMLLGPDNGFVLTGYILGAGNFDTLYTTQPNYTGIIAFYDSTMTMTGHLSYYSDDYFYVRPLESDHAPEDVFFSIDVSADVTMEGRNFTDPPGSTLHTVLAATTWNGDLNWAFGLNGNILDYDVDQMGDIWLGGSYVNEVYLDEDTFISPHIGGYVAKLDSIIAQNRKLTGRAFIDANLNGSYDSTETPLGGRMVYDLAEAHFSITEPDGTYTLFVDSFSNDITLSLPPYQTFVSPTSGVHMISPGTADSVGVDFGTSLIPNINDLTVQSFPVGLHQPGFNATINFSVTNLSTDPLVDAQVEMALDSRYNYLWSDPPEDSLSGPSIFWDAPAMYFGETRNFTIEVWLDPSILSDGDTTASVVTARPLLGDTTPADNIDSLFSLVTNSFDPNDKLVEAPGYFIDENGATSPGVQELIYTIRFQNTGSAPAYFVRLIDLLPEEVDVSSFELLWSSHPVEIYFTEERTINFEFDPIYLPFADSDFSGSQGQVVFSISLDEPLKSGNSVSNDALIYFDFNDPLLTPVAYVTVPDSNSTAIEPAPFSLARATLFPNPTSGTITLDSEFSSDDYPITATIFDEAGKLVLTKQIYTPGRIDFALEKYTTGLYQFHLQGQNGNLTTLPFFVKN